MSPLIYTLPIIAAVIGWFTNFIAVKMLFRPRKKVKILFLEIQGIFPKRQHLVAKKIGKLVSEELLSLREINEKISQPENLEMINKSIEKKLDEFLETTFPANYPIISMVVGQKRRDKLKELILTQVDTYAPQVVAQSLLHLEAQLDIEKIIEEKVTLLSAEKLEELILQVLKKEFKFIELTGAVIGFLIGIIQLLIVHF